MVNGIDIFKEFFRDFTDQYVIIGGTACDMVLGEQGLTMRTTTDIDILLVVEALNEDFVKRFWEFVKTGQYERNEHNDGPRKYYRFDRPAQKDFPATIELCSQNPDILLEDADLKYTIISVDDELSSLSAILMEGEYYRYTIEHSSEDNGVKRANAEALICLKAKAFLNLSEQKEKGGKIGSDKIRKHKLDIFRLGSILTDERFVLPDVMKNDLQKFMDIVRDNRPDAQIYRAMGSPVTDELAINVYDQIIESFGLQATF